MAVITASEKGAPLTKAELDNNFVELRSNAGGGAVADNSLAKAKLVDELKRNIRHNVIDLSYWPFVTKTPTQNSDFLLTVRTYMKTQPKTSWEIVFPYVSTGIKYYNNRWLVGVRRFKIFGNGSTFRVDNGITGDEARQRPFYVGELFQNDATTFDGSKSYDASYLFNTAEAGSETITLTTIAEAANFAVGDRVLLWGRDQTGQGYPPGVRWFDWNEVIAVNTTTGVITLEMPLQLKWESVLWDLPNTPGDGMFGGKPRIFRLDKNEENTYIEHAEFEDVIFGNSVSELNGNSGTLTCAADTLIVRRCEAEGYFWASENRLAIFEDIKARAVEFDKIVGRVYCNRIKFLQSPNNGGSIDEIYFKDCYSAENMRICPRRVAIENTHIRASGSDQYLSAIQDYPGRNPIEVMTIKQLTFSSDPANLSTTHINIALFESLTVAAVHADGSILVDASIISNTNNNYWHTRKILEGVTRLVKQDGTNGGTVTAITLDGANFKITGAWSAVPVVGEVYVYSHVNNIIDLGGHRALDGKRIWGGTSLRFCGNREFGRVREMRLTENEFILSDKTDLIFDVYGYILSFQVMVSKAYTGSHASAFITVTRHDSANNQQAPVRVNVKNIGLRNISEFALQPANTTYGDTSDITKVAGFTRKLQLNFWDSSYAKILDVTDKTKPRFEVLIKWMPF